MKDRFPAPGLVVGRGKVISGYLNAGGGQAAFGQRLLQERKRGQSSMPLLTLNTHKSSNTLG